MSQRRPHTPAILSPPPKGRIGQVAYVRVVIEGGDQEGHVWVVSAGPDRMESEPHSVRFHVSPSCLVTTLEIRQSLMARASQ